MASLQPTRSLLQRVGVILWLLIIALAFSLRVAPIRGGLPYLRYIDEGHLLHNAITMLQRQKFDTGFYNYPSLPSYLIAGALFVYAPFYTHAHGSSFWTDLQRGEDATFYDYFAPTDVIIIGRFVVLLFSVGIVVLAGVLGNALGGMRTGLLSLLLVAICPALVSRGSILIVDTIATFFAMASLCFSQRLWTHAAKNDRALWPFAAAASAAAGFAFVSKYTAGAVFVAVIVTILLLRKGPLKKLQLAVLSVFVLILTSVLTMPALLTHRARIFGTVRGVAGFYDTIPPGPGYFGAAIVPGEMGIPLVVVSLIGIAFMLWRSGISRAAAISWSTFGLVLVTALVRHPFQPFRNLLPLVPPLCLTAAFLIARGHLLVAQPRARQIIARWIAPAAALGLTLSLILPAWRNVDRQRKLVDSRVRAVNWLGKHVAASDRILAIRELAIHPAEWKRIGREPTLVPWSNAADLLERESFDRIIDGEFDLRFSPDRQRWSDYRDRWSAETTPLPVAKTFGKIPCFIEPGVWRTNDERIVIRRGTSR